MKNPSIPCPAVSGEVRDFGVDHPDEYKACVPQPLRQSWHGPDAMPTEKALASVGAAATGLSFYVCLQDSDIFSTATADNQKMWMLGDVAEFFVKPGVERSDYWEIHVTPNDFIMDIHIPDRERFMDGTITWDEVIAPDSGAEKRVQVLDGSWAVELCIPWRAFGMETVPPAGTVWQIAVCRYNCSGGLEDPELSSTARFTEPGFHRYEEFTDLLFG